MEIHSFLEDKLRSYYVSEPISNGDFFIQKTGEYTISGEETNRLFSLANTFGYSITITKSIYITIYFTKN